MAVLASIEGGGRVTQQFGAPSVNVASLEPSMWAVPGKAYWLEFPGSSFYSHFHPGIDRAADYGSPVQAMEAGTVVFAGFKDSISGIQVEVEIRPGTRFSVNHLRGYAVRLGNSVKRGQTIGWVGITGATTGPHTHEGLSIQQRGSDGILRTFLVNPADYQDGGKFADSPDVRPELQKVAIDKAELPVTIYRGIPDFSHSPDIFGTARSAGIFRRGRRVSGINYQFNYVRDHESRHHGTFALVIGYGKRLAIQRRHVHFV